MHHAMHCTHTRLCIAVLCGGCQSKTSVRRPYMPSALQYPYMWGGCDMSPIRHPCISMSWITLKNKLLIACGPWPARQATTSDGSAMTMSPTSSVKKISTGRHTVVSSARTMGYNQLLGYRYCTDRLDCNSSLTNSPRLSRSSSTICRQGSSTCSVRCTISSARCTACDPQTPQTNAGGAGGGAAGVTIRRAWNFCRERKCPKDHLYNCIVLYTTAGRFGGNSRADAAASGVA